MIMMTSENVTRKIDSLGRISIPKGLRQRLDISEGDELEIFTMEEKGRQFICLGAVQEKETAREIIEKALDCGLGVEELIAALEELK